MDCASIRNLCACRRRRTRALHIKIVSKGDCRGICCNVARDRARAVNDAVSMNDISCQHRTRVHNKTLVGSNPYVKRISIDIVRFSGGRAKEVRFRSVTDIVFNIDGYPCAVADGSRRYDSGKHVRIEEAAGESGCITIHFEFQWLCRCNG